MTAPPSTTTTIGMVGFGKIGAAIAKHILAAGHPMLGWARRPAALDEFVARGGIAVRTLAEIGQADIVISIVFDDAATRAVAMQPGGFIPAMRPGTIHVAMATISPALSRELHDTHAARGQRYLASPVFGRPDAAANGELAIMGSGAIETYQAVRPILATAGTTRWVGPEPEQAMLLKLAGNHMILTMGDLLGETFALLRAGGVSGAETKEALLDTLMPGIFAGYAWRMSTNRMHPALRPAPSGGRTTDSSSPPPKRCTPISPSRASCAASNP